MTRYRFNEGSSGEIRIALPTVDGAVLTVADLTAVSLTLYDLGTYDPGSPPTGILNDRDRQDVRGGSPAGDYHVTYDDGVLIWAVQPADNSIVDRRRQVERHRALVVFAVGEDAYPSEIEIEVVNLRTR